MEIKNKLSTSRQLKTPIKPDRLAPIVRKSSKSGQIGGTDETSITIDELRRRVNDLGFENSKLVNQVMHAELSVQNYRGFLSSFSGTNNKVDVGIQTDTVTNQGLEIMLRKSESRIQQLEEQKLSLRRERDFLRQELQLRQSGTADDSHIVEELKQIISSLQKRLEEHEIARQSVDTNAANLLRSKKGVADLKNLLDNDKNVINDQLSEFSNFLQTNMLSIAQVAQLKNDENKKLRTLITKSKEAERTLRFKLDESERQRCELMATVKRMESHIMLEASSCAAVKISTKNTCDTGCDPIRLDSDSEESSRLEAQIWRDKYTKLFLRVQEASGQVDELEARAATQLKATRHMAHVRDLQRVAALRETSLERDRALADTKHSKDVCKVLMFCLETAEKALTESAPQIVTRLVEGRVKRLEALEEMALEQRRDLDQRSAETCATSSLHLEAFQTKAERKEQEAESDYQTLLLELKDLLDMNNFERSICFDSRLDAAAEEAFEYDVLTEFRNRLFSNNS